MKYFGLLVLLSLRFALPAFAAENAPPRLVRYHFTDREQVRALFESGADIPAHGKGWVDVVMPAGSQMAAKRFTTLASAVRGLKAQTLMEDAEAQFRAFAATPDLGVYHNLAEVKAELDAAAAAYPGIAKVSVIGKTGEGRDIWAIRIASSPQDGQKPAFLFTGAHHAREWISIEVPMAIVKKLTEGYAADAAIQALVDSRETWIVPVVNPDGVQHSQTQYKMWRKNRRNNGDGTFGVDPNRNYGYKWGGEGSSPDTSSDIYRGPSAFSEPETKAIRDLSMAKKFVAAISFHSYSELVLWPWGYTTEPPRDAASFIKFGRAMAQINGYTPEQSTELYPTTGDFDDFMYGGMGTLAFTIELGQQFVPPESEVAGIVAANLKASLLLLQTASEPFPPLLHDTLASTTNVAGPYPVQATLREGPGLAGARVDLVFKRASASTEERTTMTAGAANVYGASIPGGALGEVSYHFELTTAEGAARRVPADGDYKFKVVDSLVLLVADDNGSAYSTHYAAALDALGKAYSVWDTKASGSPTANALRGASAVVWFCGDASSNTLTASDQTALAGYLSNGGRLLLFGQDIGYEIKATAFYKESLKAKFIADASGDAGLAGAAGSFAAGLSLTLGEQDAVAQRYPEAIEPLQGAKTLFAYGNGKIGAICSSGGAARVAYFGFGLEGVSGAETRMALLGKGLDWAASNAESNIARVKDLEKAATAGDRSAVRALSAAADEASRALQSGWERGDQSSAKHLSGAEVPRSLRPVVREAGRLLKFEKLGGK